MPPAGDLMTQLRAGTRDLHEAAESTLDLDECLADRFAYGHMLADLRGFYASAEESLSALSGWSTLEPAVDIQLRCRVPLLDADLKQLGVPVPTGRSEALEGLLSGSLTAGIGCLYVLEGSTLGGKLVARRAQAQLGADLPVAFFATADRPQLGAQWQALKQALNAFGLARGPAAEAEVLAAARGTFAALQQWLLSRSAARLSP
jgi:heme oxygenase